MMHHKEKWNLYSLRGLVIAFSLSTLFVILPARSENGDFLDNISKLEIDKFEGADADSGESAGINQKKDSGSKKISQKQDVIRQKINKNNKAESTLNTLRKQNAELRSAAKTVQKKLDDTTRTLSAQIAALKAQRASQDCGEKTTSDALTKKNAELSVAAKTAQKKLDDTTRVLSAQIAALKTQKEQSESAQKATIDTLTKKNAELATVAATAQKKLDDTTRILSIQIAALKTQREQSKSIQKTAVDTLTNNNAELTAAAEAAQKKLDDTTRTLSAQIAALKTQKGQSESAQKVTIDTLTRKNLELTVAAATAQKKLDDTTRTLSAQIAALKTQKGQSESAQKATIDTLTKKNAELVVAAEAVQKKYDSSVLVLNNKNKELQSTIDSLSIKDNNLNFSDKSIKDAYALGVFYLTRALSDVTKIGDDGVKLTFSALVSGFNDAYNKKTKIKDDEIEKIVNTLNDHVASKHINIEKRIMDKIKNKKYEILPNGVYFVVERKGKKRYKQGESVSLNILEKKFDGTPILNTMNSRIVYDKQTDPLMEKILSSAFRGGMVTLYGQAGLLYSSTPVDIDPDTLISITFELIP